jgi:hypothetical protein
MDRWGKADPRHGSTADSLAELISGVILCEQTIILENLHHSFNALAHVGVAVQQLRTIERARSAAPVSFALIRNTI